MYYIGIDCGMAGYISVLDDCGRLVEMHKAPLVKVEDQAIKHWYDTSKLIEIFKMYQPSNVVIEMQQVMSGQGLVTSGTVMRGFGLYEGIISCLYPYSYRIVKAVNWQNYLAKKYLKDLNIHFKPKTKNLELIQELILDDKYKKWYTKFCNNKTTALSKIRSAFIYYKVMENLGLLSSLDVIKYTNNNAIDGFLISKYCYDTISSVPQKLII